MIDDRLRRRVLWSMPTGLYLIGSRAVVDGEDRVNLMTANLVVQVAVEPKLVGVAVERDALTAQLITHGGAFSVCFVAREDRPLVRRFVKPVGTVDRDGDANPVTMAGEPVTTKQTGAPIVCRSPAWLDCSLRQQLDLGSHRFFVGEVVAGGGPGAGGAGDVHDARSSVEDWFEPLRMEDTRMNYGG